MKYAKVTKNDKPDSTIFVKPSLTVLISCYLNTGF